MMEIVMKPMLKKAAQILFSVTFTGVLLLAGCTYEEPIAAKPTRKVVPELIGNWTQIGDRPEKLRVRQLDAENYVLAYEGDLYRAYHTEVTGLPLVSVQSLQPEQRKWAYLTWKLSSDGNTLTLRLVNDKVVSPELKTSSAVRKVLKENAKNPELFEEEFRYSRDK